MVILWEVIVNYLEVNNINKYQIGEVYNLLKVIGLYRDENNRLCAKTECIKCHKIKYIRASDLYNSRVNSCICQSYKHGLCGTKLYSVYSNMKYRCYNPHCHAYKDYGKKGIRICDEWLGDDGFMNFYNWSMQNGYHDGLTIDRIDSNQSYSPINCRWISLSENVASANKENVRRHANKGTYYGISPSGEYYEFDNANQFAREHQELNASNIRDVANQRKKTHRGWKFGFKNN